jgi:6-phosphogluconolactonase
MSTAFDPTMSDPTVVVHPDPDVLAAAAAARLIATLADVQARKGSASVVLTGGGTGIAVLDQVRRSPARDAVDWSALDVFWGDERFVPADDPERNEKQAREALLDHVPVDEARVHAMAASDGPFGDDPDAAAAGYAEVLAAAARSADTATSAAQVPSFDVLLLGLGGEGHTASLFPHTAEVREDRASVVPVRDCPKPPPTRLSLTLPAIRAAEEVWLLTAGEAKAEAVSLALAGADPVSLPVAGARGKQRTVWLLDRAAARRFKPHTE